MVGQLFGRYRIESKLGEGGMGVVYKAHDTQLGRPVAIKVLPADKVADADRKSRFVQEAKAASALNHPAIVTVHDFAEVDGRAFIVMEYLAGTTLDQVIPPDGLPPKIVFKYGVQIADALSRAHEGGILHRDLKPSNVFITDDGRVKVLDFGLAKLIEPDPSGNATTVALTDAGVVVGTSAYMSPEQADGRKLDARSDIFSFGSVLYEMATGRRAFSGESRLSVLRKIVTEDPRLPSQVSGKVAVDLEKAILRCLRKDPARRFQTMADLKVALEDLSSESDAAVVAPQGRASSRRWLLAAGAIAAAAVIAAVVLQERPDTLIDGEPLVAVPVTALAGSLREPSLSPEGTHIVFRWNGPAQDNADIYVQQLGVTSPPLRLTTDSGDDYGASWSPDGRSIAFLRGGFGGGASELRVVPPLGGAERKIADLNVAFTLLRPPSVAWCPDSSCIVVTKTVSGRHLLFSIAIDTGEEQQLTFSGALATDLDLDPAISPDGRWLAFRRDTTPYTGDYYRLPMRGRATERIEPVRLTVSKSAGDSPGKAAWTPDSRALIFGASGALWRVNAVEPVERTRLAFVGQEGMHPSLATMRDGSVRLVYVRATNDTNVWRLSTPEAGAPATSAPVYVIRSPRSEYLPNLSPDGRRVLFLSNRSGTSEFWTADRDGGNLLQLTTLASLPGFGRWSPDSSQIVFHSDPRGRPDILVVAANGGQPRVITEKFEGGAFPSYSRDGRWIYFTNNRDGKIWRIAVSGGEPVPVSAIEASVAIESVDGRDLYYADTFSQAASVWRQPLSGGAPEKLFGGVANVAFDVIAGGIYYLDRSTKVARVAYYDFATRRSTIVADDLGAVTPGLTASPDGRNIFFSRADSSADELMLVDRFR
jgi:Tol biopolymer transport system component/predicted Ser/Thr protein kinase